MAIIKEQVPAEMKAEWELYTRSTALEICLLVSTRAKHIGYPPTQQSNSSEYSRQKCVHIRTKNMYGHNLFYWASQVLRFLQTECKTPSSAKITTRFIEVIWNRFHNISEVCLYENFHRSTIQNNPNMETIQKPSCRRIRHGSTHNEIYTIQRSELQLHTIMWLNLTENGDTKKPGTQEYKWCDSIGTKILEMQTSLLHKGQRLPGLGADKGSLQRARGLSVAMVSQVYISLSTPIKLQTLNGNRFLVHKLYLNKVD